MRIVALITFLLAAEAARAAPLGPMPATHIRVIDGDTVEMRVAIWIDQELTVAVRVAGVDAPELFRPQCAAEKDKAFAAKAFVEDFLGDGEATLFDIAQGKYAGRVIARIEAGGRDLGAALIAAGHAAYGTSKDWCAPGA
jgi:endonuclease YncB( thermonuclease family)